MNEPPARASNPVRKRVLLFLAFLGSRECQETCAKYYPAEKLAFELCRLWFDEIYVPGARYLDGLKGDRSAREVQQFQSCFTDDEQESLERFHRFLELRVEMLPEKARRQGIFPQNDRWESVTRDARHLCADLDTEIEPLEQQLSWIVQLVLRSDG